MIKASQILEEYLTLYKYGKYSTPIFLNPTRSELRELGDTIRFIADSGEKKIYVGNARVVCHQDINDFLGLKIGPTHLLGYAERKGEKYVLMGSAELGCRLDYVNIHNEYSEYIKTFFAQDWSWVNRYIDIEPYFDFVKNFLKTQKTPHTRFPVSIPL
jgi:hypothetical protein